MKQYIISRIDNLNHLWEIKTKKYRLADDEEKKQLWKEAEDIEIRIDELQKLLKAMKEVK